MGIISDVKCSRCDRRYSGLRSRCPYCGALRVKRGKRASDGDNALWKLIIGILLLVVLIAAVIILLVTSLGGDNGEEANDPVQTVTDNTGNDEDANTNTDTDNNDNSAGINGDDGVSSVDGTTPTPDDITGDDDTADNNTTVTTPGTTPDSATTPGTTDTPAQNKVESVQITYLGTATEDITISVGNVLTLGCATTPADAEATPVWASSDENVLTVLQSGELHAVGKGTVDLTVTVDGVTATCIVRVK